MSYETDIQPKWNLILRLEQDWLVLHLSFLNMSYHHQRHQFAFKALMNCKIWKAWLISLGIIFRPRIHQKRVHSPLTSTILTQMKTVASFWLTFRHQKPRGVTCCHLTDTVVEDHQQQGIQLIQVYWLQNLFIAGCLQHLFISCSVQKMEDDLFHVSWTTFLLSYLHVHWLNLIGEVSAQVCLVC